MKDIEIFYDNTWSKASITFLELGINIISNVKNKIIPYDDIKTITKCEDILKITYVKKIDIDRKEIVVVIKAPNEVINVLSEKFEIVEEQKETIVVNSNKEEEIHVRQVSPFTRLVKLLCLALCIIFIIFGFNINKDTTIFGLYINGNKYAPFIISFVFGAIFVILSLPKDNKNVKER